MANVVPKASTAAYWPKACTPRLRTISTEKPNDNSLITSCAAIPKAELRSTVRENLCMMSILPIPGCSVSCVKLNE